MNAPDGCMFPLCRCYAYSGGRVMPFDHIKGEWRSLAHTCEHEECEWPKCQQFSGCAPLSPDDEFAHCEKRT